MLAETRGGAVPEGAHLVACTSPESRWPRQGNCSCSSRPKPRSSRTWHLQGVTCALPHQVLPPPLRAVTAGTGPILRNPFFNYIFQWPLSGFCVLAGVPPSRQTLTQERKRIDMSPPPLSFSQAPVSLSTGKRDYFLISGKSPKPNVVPVGKPGGPPPSSPNAAGRLSV